MRDTRGPPLRGALWAYNHADWYVIEVLQKPNSYRGLGPSGGGLVAGWSNAPALNQYNQANYSSEALSQQWQAAACSAATPDWLLGAYGVRLGGIDQGIVLIGPNTGISPSKPIRHTWLSRSLSKQMRWVTLRLVASILLSATCALSAISAWAQDAPYCAAGQTVDWQPVLVPLSQQLGDTMGQPLECPHPSDNSDDIVQQTTTGLAIVRATTGAPTFTDGTTRWALIGTDVMSWTDAGLDPPAAQTTCAQQPVRGFGLVFESQPEAWQLLGCPTLGEVAERVAVQRFEHGWMLWQARRDTVPPTIYVLFDDSRKYLRFDDTYMSGADLLGTSGTPPAGLVQPTGGFGKLWLEASALSIRDRLGWATATESGGDGAVETFQHGLMVYTPDPREIFVLAASTADSPAQVAQVWRAYADTFTD